MNKTQMVEELIKACPTDLMLECLWEDEAIVNRLRNKLLTISELNLQPYHNHFIGRSVTTEKIQTKNIPMFTGGNNTQQYISNNHEIQD